MVSLKISFATVLALLLVGCGSGEPKGWKLKGDLEGKTLWVEVDPKLMKTYERYEAAVDDVCSGSCAMVLFFQAGDVMPPSGENGVKFNGSLEGYSPVAIWASGKFTRWDCERAPSEGTPPDISCGAGGQNFYPLVLDIAVRDGWVTGCKMPSFDGLRVVQSYLKTVPDEARREKLLGGYRSSYDSARDGPDDPAFCNKAKARIDGAAKKAKAILEEEIKKAAHS